MSKRILTEGIHGKVIRNLEARYKVERDRKKKIELKRKIEIEKSASQGTISHLFQLSRRASQIKIKKYEWDHYSEIYNIPEHIAYLKKLKEKGILCKRSDFQAKSVEDVLFDAETVGKAIYLMESFGLIEKLYKPALRRFAKFGKKLNWKVILFTQLGKNKDNYEIIQDILSKLQIKYEKFEKSIEVELDRNKYLKINSLDDKLEYIYQSNNSSFKINQDDVLRAIYEYLLVDETQIKTVDIYEFYKEYNGLFRTQSEKDVAYKIIDLCSTKGRSFREIIS